MKKMARYICLYAGIVILIIAAVLDNVWRPFSYAERGFVVIVGFSLILTAMIIQAIQNREKNSHPLFFVGKLAGIVFVYIFLLWMVISCFLETL